MRDDFWYPSRQRDSDIRWWYNNTDSGMFSDMEFFQKISDMEFLLRQDILHFDRKDTAPAVR
jgi:hypothetical protein